MLNWIRRWVCSKSIAERSHRIALAAKVDSTPSLDAVAGGHAAIAP